MNGFDNLGIFGLFSNFLKSMGGNMGDAFGSMPGWGAKAAEGVGTGMGKPVETAMTKAAGGNDATGWGALLGDKGISGLMDAGLAIPSFLQQRNALKDQKQFLDFQKQAYLDDVERQKKSHNYQLYDNAKSNYYKTDSNGNTVYSPVHENPEDILKRWGL